MASPANAKTTSFSSSSSIPCRTNPCLKKSEAVDPMRRSCSGNPFVKPSSILTNPRGGGGGAFALHPNTPANSPSDFPRRHSTGRDTSLQDSDKENGKDQNVKPTRVRSPAPPSKGMRNFMSPTISAASKMNASPRKKILVEKNIEQPVRSSGGDHYSTPDTGLLKHKKVVSFADVQSVIMGDDDESTMEAGLKHKKVVSFSDVPSIMVEDNINAHDLSSSNEEEEECGVEEAATKIKPDFETITEDKDSVNVDPSFNISPRVPISPSCPVLAPLDADPSLPPYDPKTNYLSPRPQFLHYRPNPRIDLYREREGKELDQLHFAFESYASESYSDTDATEETQSEGSQRESEDVSSEERMEEEEEGDATGPDIGEESVDEAKRVSKPRFSSRWKFITFLLVLAFAYLAIQGANSPVFPHGFEELSLSNFQVPPEVTDLAKAHFDRFTENLQHWSASFVSYASNIFSSSRKGHKLGPFQYANLSCLLVEDHMSEEGHLMFGHSLLEPVKERGFEADEAIDENDEQELEEPEEDHQESGAYGNLELDSEKGSDQVQPAEHLSNANLNDQPSIMPQAAEIQHDLSAAMIEQDHLEAGESKDVEFAAGQIDAETQDDTKSENPEGDDDLNNIAETEFVDEEVNSDNPKTEASTANSQSSEIQHDLSAEMIEQDHLEAGESKDVEFAAGQIDAEYGSNANLNDQSSMMPQAAETQDDTKSENLKGDDDLNNIAETELLDEEVNSDNPKTEASIANSQSSEVVDSTFYGQEEGNFPANDVMALLLVCLLAAVAFIYTKRGKASVPNAAVPEEQPMLAKKPEYIPLSVSSSKDASRERLSSRNWQTEVDMANESCPSEMSSCQKTSSSSSYSKMVLKESSEHQSQETTTKTRKSNRRESLASSDYSMDSPSYGSFTTYEKLPKKHGGDEGMVTPVRRSSRIRKQVVTSP